MILYGIAFVVLMFGLALIGVAYLSAHRTFIPVIRGAALLWWPGLFFASMSVLIVLIPSVFAYSVCESECAIGGSSEQPYAANVNKDYENCVASGMNEARRNAFERMKEGATGVDPEAAAKSIEPELRVSCHQIVVSTCVSTCYHPDMGLKK